MQAVCGGKEALMVRGLNVFGHCAEVVCAQRLKNKEINESVVIGE